MKKLLSVVLTLMMIFSMFTTISAEEISDYIQTPDTANFAEFELPITVSAKTGDQEYKTAAEGFAIDAEDLSSGIGVDFRAELNMQPIRDIFETGGFDLLKSADDFNDGRVSTEVTVTVEYDTATVVDNEAGALVGNAVSAYKEVGDRVHTVDGNKTKTQIKFQQTNNEISVAELLSNQGLYFENIVFDLAGAVAYNAEGTYKIQVSFEGKTTFAFPSKVVNIAYKNTEDSGNFVVNATVQHFLKVVPAVPATCEEMGWTEGVICVTHNKYDCGASGTIVPQNNIPKLNHNTVFVPGIAASCIATGVKAHYMCILCKKDFTHADASAPLNKDDLVLPKSAHTFSPISGSPATCTEKGISDGRYCSVCGYTDGLTSIPALGHAKVTDPAVPATCENPGKTEGSHCSVCDKVLVAQKPVPAIGHNWGEWSVTLQPTEQAEGSKTRVCLNDSNHTETVAIPKLVHTCVISEEDAVITKAATCTEAGEKQNYCACGEPVGAPVVIPATGHSANTGHVSAVAATCTATGILEHWSCETCGGLFIDAARTKKVTSVVTDKDTSNHAQTVSLRRIEPTCELDGLTEGTKCVACSLITTPQNVIPKTGHDFEEVDEVPATCTHTGLLAHKHCKVCDKDFSHDLITEITIEEYTIPALGHSYDYANQVIVTPPSDDVEGLARVYCINACGLFKEVTLSRVHTKHNEECEKIVKPATCTEKGIKQIIYTCCNTVKEDNIEIPPSHKLKMVRAVESDCFKHGSKAHWYCTVCEKTFEDRYGRREITNLDDLKTDKKVHVRENRPDETDPDGSVYSVTECKHCHDRVRIKKNNKARVDDHHDVNIKEEKDKIKEDRHNEDKEETRREVKVNTQINIDDREISANLEQKIHENDTETNKASENKVVVDIVIEKITSYHDIDDNNKVVDEEREIVKETDDLIKIVIDIPVGMRGFADYLVHRMHDGIAQILTTNSDDNDGEYIEIAADKSKVTIYVKRFSEYAVVGYDTQVNPDPSVVTSNTRSSYVVRFNTNGGVVLNSIDVKRGATVELPTPVRDGYTFAGWYTDSSFKTPFDANTAITKSYTLYAKWIERGACSGTTEDGCPSLNFYDLNPAMWYHMGVDYVLNEGMMNGVAATQFAPDWNVTRAMLVTVLWRSEGMPEAGNTTFTDLEDGLYYVDAVNWAAANGVVTGYSDTTFAPNDAITREQFATIMYRYAKNNGYDLSAGENTNILSYVDWPFISDYALEAMQYTLGTGLIKGRTETTLNPQDNTTRAEMATILYRFFTEIE